MAAKLLDHEKNCYVHWEQRIQFPEEIVTFKNLKHQVEAPWLIYADRESILKKLTIDPNTNSNKYQHHIACSWSYKIVSNVSPTKYEMRYYFGVDALKKFIESLLRDLKNIILPSIETEVKMIWDDAAIQKFQAAKDCYICEKNYLLQMSRETTVTSAADFEGGLTAVAVYNIKSLRRIIPSQ